MTNRWFRVLMLCAIQLYSVAQTVNENVSDFSVIDLNADNVISLAEFKKWYHKSDDSNKAENLFASYDLNSDGRLTLPEFVPLANQFSQQPAKEEFFKHLDTNNDNIVTYSDIKNLKEQIPKEITNGLFQIADSNNDGQITLDEYKLAATVNQ